MTTLFWRRLSTNRTSRKGQSSPPRQEYIMWGWVELSLAAVAAFYINQTQLSARSRFVLDPSMPHLVLATYLRFTSNVTFIISSDKTEWARKFFTIFVTPLHPLRWYMGYETVQSSPEMTIHLSQNDFATCLLFSISTNRISGCSHLPTNVVDIIKTSTTFVSDKWRQIWTGVCRQMSLTFIADTINTSATFVADNKISPTNADVWRRHLAELWADILWLSTNHCKRYKGHHAHRSSTRPSSVFWLQVADKHYCRRHMSPTNVDKCEQEITQTML